jgi:hypothetical protein
VLTKHGQVFIFQDREREVMTTIIVAFDTEQDAQDAIDHLTQANLGEVRSRVLDSSEPLSYPKQGSTSPVITPDLGSLEVRPTETPKVPEAMHDDRQADVSASIPTTYDAVDPGGVQVMIEVDDEYEEAVRRLLSERQD